MSERGDERPERGSGFPAFLALLLLGAWAALVGLGLVAFAHALAMVPFGFLAVFVFADRSLAVLRALLVGLPAWVLGVACAAAALGYRERSLGAPGPSQLVVPAFAVALGVVVGLALRRGFFRLLLLPVRLAVAAAVLAIVLAFLLAPCLDDAPPAREPASASEWASMGKRLAAADPRTVSSGETRTLRLAKRELEVVSASVAPAVLGARLTHGFATVDGDRLVVHVSWPVPWISRFANLTLSARASVAQGRLSLAAPRLRAGRREVPTRVMDALAPVLGMLVSLERPVRRVLPAIQELRVERDALTLRYGRLDLPVEPDAPSSRPPAEAPPL